MFSQSADSIERSEQCGFSSKIAEQRAQVCHRTDRLSNTVSQRTLQVGTAAATTAPAPAPLGPIVAAQPAAALLQAAAAANPAPAALPPQIPIQPDISNLFHQYTAVANNAAANPVAAAAAPYIYQPLAAVLPYGR